MIELPKDAEGREIPLDTDALYDKNGERLPIYEWEYFPKLTHIKWKVRLLFDVSGVHHFPNEYLLTPPDSLEKLEEDLDRGKDICDYFEDCPEDMDGKSCSECKKAALKNIASRIRKLRGEDE